LCRGGGLQFIAGVALRVYPYQSAKNGGNYEGIEKALIPWRHPEGRQSRRVLRGSARHPQAGPRSALDPLQDQYDALLIHTLFLRFLSVFLTSQSEVSHSDIKSNADGSPSITPPSQTSQCRLHIRKKSIRGKRK